MSLLSNIATALMVAWTVDHERLAHDEGYRLAIVARLRGDRTTPSDEAPAMDLPRAA